MPKHETFHRKEVLEQAKNTFWNKGYNATSMQDLVNATQLNRSSIYNSFGDKYNLFMECLKLYQANERSKATQLILKASSPLQSIESFFNSILQEIDSKQNKSCFIVSCTTEIGNSKAEVFEFLKNNETHVKEFFRSILEEAKNQKEIKADSDIEGLASYLFSSLQGLRVTGIISQKKEELQSIVHHTLSVLK